MNQIFEGLDRVQVVTDDILVYASNASEHNARLKAVLQRAREANLRLNPDTTKICKTEVNYVGHTFSSQGLKPNPERVQAIVEMLEPSDKARFKDFSV